MNIGWQTDVLKCAFIPLGSAFSPVWAVKIFRYMENRSTMADTCLFMWNWALFRISVSVKGLLKFNIQTLHSTFLEFLKNSVLSRLSAVKNNPRSQWPITVKACYPLSPPDSRWLGEGSGCFVPCGHSAPRRYSGTQLLPSWGATIYHAASRVMPQGREGHVWPWCASPLQLSPWPESVMSQPQCSQWGNRPAMDPEEAELGVVRAPRCLWSTPVLKSPDTV